MLVMEMEKVIERSSRLLVIYLSSLLELKRVWKGIICVEILLMEKDYEWIMLMLS